MEIGDKVRYKPNGKLGDLKITGTIVDVSYGVYKIKWDDGFKDTWEDDEIIPLKEASND